MIGRPPIKITDALCRKAQSFAAQGLTLEQIALVIGIHRDTLNEKKKEFSDFSDAIKKGQAQGVAVVTNKLFEKARDGDNTSMIFYLKNRAGWKDKQELLVPGGFNITIGKKDAGNL